VPETGFFALAVSNHCAYYDLEVANSAKLNQARYRIGVPAGTILIQEEPEGTVDDNHEHSVSLKVAIRHEVS
jgi:hypothetical protein